MGEIVSELIKRHGIYGIYLGLMALLVGASLNFISGMILEDRKERIKERERVEAMTDKLLDVIGNTNKVIEKNTLVLEKSSSEQVAEEVERIREIVTQMTQENAAYIREVRQLLKENKDPKGR